MGDKKAPTRNRIGVSLQSMKLIYKCLLCDHTFPATQASSQ